MRDEISIPYNNLFLVSIIGLIVSVYYQFPGVSIIFGFLFGYSLKTISAACKCGSN
jgi:hypothetical protein